MNRNHRKSGGAYSGLNRTKPSRSPSSTNTSPTNKRRTKPSSQRDRHDRPKRPTRPNNTNIRRRAKRTSQPHPTNRRRAKRTSQPGVGIGGEHVEGRHAIRELLLAGRRRTRTVVVAKGTEPAPIIDHIIDLAREHKVKVRQASRSELEAAARTSASQGVIAYADPLPVFDLTDLISKPVTCPTTKPTGHTHNPNQPPFLLLIDGITDPGNLGAVLRTAECAGVTGIVLRKHRATRITPTVAKAAAGAIEYLRIAMVPGLPSAMNVISQSHVWIVGLDPSGEKSLHMVDLAEEAIALALGAEGSGLSRLVAQRCDVLASIPTRGFVESLNVSAAAAVACYEISRHRQYSVQ